MRLQVHGERLYVGNLPPDVTRQKLRDLFNAHGDVVGVTFFRDAGTNAPSGCAYIQMRTTAEAVVCATHLDGVLFEGRALRVAASAHPGTPTPPANAPRSARAPLFVNARTESVGGSRFFTPPPPSPRKTPRPRS